MTRQQQFVFVRVAIGTVLAAVVAVVVARASMARDRAGWDPHYGDPDGESIVQVFGYLTGVGVFLALAIAICTLELALWLRRRRIARTSAGPRPDAA